MGSLTAVAGVTCRVEPDYGVRKLEKVGGKAQAIGTVHGVGYRYLSPMLVDDVASAFDIIRV